MSKNQLPAKLDVELEAPADFTSPDVLYDDLIKDDPQIPSVR